jgi:hypothetical protein
VNTTVEVNTTAVASTTATSAAEDVDEDEVEVGGKAVRFRREGIFTIGIPE